MAKASPKPLTISPGCVRWRLADVIGHEGGDPTADDAHTFMTVDDVAKRYGVHVGTVWRWASAAKAAA